MGFSLMNGLAGLGQGVAEFAGRAGLEQQRADLAMKQTVLADQLAGAREETSDTRRAGFAATAAEKEHGFLSTQGDLNRANQLSVAQTGAGATLGAAGIHAAAERDASAARERSSKYQVDAEERISIAGRAQQKPFVDAQVEEMRAKAALSDLQFKQVGRTLDLNTQLADEYAKPDPDRKAIGSLSSQIKAMNYDPKVDAAILTAADGMATTSQQAVTSLITRETALTAQLNTAEIEPGVKAATRASLDDVKAQIVTAKGRAEFFAKLAQRRMADVTDTTVPGTAPPLPPGVPLGSRYNFDHDIFQAPDGTLFDRQGKTTMPPGQFGPAVPAGFMHNGAGAGP